MTPRRERATALRYVESSALVGYLLEGDRDAEDSLSADGEIVASALTFAEASRAIVRAVDGGRITPGEAGGLVRVLERFRRRTATIAISPEILARVGRPFPIEPVRTLDAIHLATAESLDEFAHNVTVVTRDARIRRNAERIGYAIE